MKKLMIAFVLAVLTTGPALASEEAAAVMVPVHQFVDSFNKGDTKTALAACADEMAIIDEFAPYVWQGAGACQKWFEGFDADAQKRGITDGVVTLGPPRLVDISGGHAYLVIPAGYTYKEKGKPMAESGATITLSMGKGSTGWRITGWAWSKK